MAAFTINNAPAVNVRATATQAAAGAGRRNVALFVAASAAPPGAVGSERLVIRDGATGVGAIIYQLDFVAGFSGLGFPVFLIGSANTAMTIEFVANGGGGEFQTVSLQGYTI